ncbi:MAG: hypothetical protein Q4P17_03920 [Methanobacterium sp.]|nr:hypothetical protein [Methanobacterium sp.]
MGTSSNVLSIVFICVLLCALVWLAAFSTYPLWLLLAVAFGGLKFIQTYHNEKKSESALENKNLDYLEQKKKEIEDKKRRVMDEIEKVQKKDTEKESKDDEVI